MAELREVTAASFYALRGATFGGRTNAWATPQNVSGVANSVYTGQSFTFPSTNNDYLMAGPYDASAVIPTTAAVKGIEFQFTTGPSTTNNVPVEVHGSDGTNVFAAFRSFQMSGAITTYTVGSAADITFLGPYGNSFPFVARAAVLMAPTSAGGAALARFDSCLMTVYYDKPLIIKVNSSEYGYQSQSVGPISISPQRPEIGFEMSNVGLVLNIRTPVSKFGHEIGSVGVSKNILVNSSEYGYESLSVPQVDTSVTIGYEITGPVLSQVHNQRIGSFEMGFLTKTVDYTAFKFAQSDSAEFGFEIGGPVLRRFIGNVTPKRRVISVAQGSRTSVILHQNRTVDVQYVNRTISVPEENRTIVVPERDRHHRMLEQNH